MGFRTPAVVPTGPILAGVILSVETWSVKTWMEDGDAFRC
jgi:hypothetical protein